MGMFGAVLDESYMWAYADGTTLTVDRPGEDGNGGESSLTSCVP